MLFSPKSNYNIITNHISLKINEKLSTFKRQKYVESLVLSPFNDSDVVYSPCLANRFKIKIQNVQKLCLHLGDNESHKLAEIG